MEALTAIVKSIEITNIRSAQHAGNSLAFLVLAIMAGIRGRDARNSFLLGLFIIFSSLAARSMYYSYLTHYARDEAYRIPSIPIVVDLVTLAGALMAIWCAWHPRRR